jgi:hypothetical protein
MICGDELGPHFIVGSGDQALFELALPPCEALAIAFALDRPAKPTIRPKEKLREADATAPAGRPVGPGLQPARLPAAIAAGPPTVTYQPTGQYLLTELREGVLELNEYWIPEDSANLAASRQDGEHRACRSSTSHRRMILLRPHQPAEPGREVREEARRLARQRRAADRAATSAVLSPRHRRGPGFYGKPGPAGHLLTTRKEGVTCAQQRMRRGADRAGWAVTVARRDPRTA